MFENQALDCLQKVDLLAAARCNMFSYALVLYQSTLLNFTLKSAQAYATIANSFKGYQGYDLLTIKELTETSDTLIEESSHTDDDANKKSFAFGGGDHEFAEQAEEANTAEDNTLSLKGIDEKLVNIDSCHDLETNMSGLNIRSCPNKFINDVPVVNDHLKKKIGEMFLHDPEHHLELEKSLVELDLAMDSFTGSSMGFDLKKTGSLASQNKEEQNQPALDFLTSENVALLEDILNSGSKEVDDWASLSNDTFLPPGILNQSLGDAILGVGKDRPSHGVAKKRDYSESGSENSWLDLFADLDPLANHAIESLTKCSKSNAPA